MLSHAHVTFCMHAASTQHPIMKLLVVLVVFSCSGLLARAKQKEIFLNGDNWSLSDEAGRVKQVQATVPGIVHTDLL